MESLIILHGWQSSKEKWQAVKKEVEKYGLRTIGPDLPGFKEETKLIKSWSLDDYLVWLEKFLFNKKRNFSQANSKMFLLGHSFGGRLAIKFAAKHPEKLKGLILVSAAGITPRPKIKIAIFALFSKIANKAFSLPVLNFFHPFIRRAVYFLIGLDDYRLIKTDVMKETFKKVISEDLTSLLSKIKTPTLLIWGDKDRATPLKDAYLMNKEIENSRLEILKGLDHTPYKQNPGLLAQKIIDFIGLK